MIQGGRDSVEIGDNNSQGCDSFRTPAWRVALSVEPECYDCIFAGKDGLSPRQKGVSADPLFYYE